MMSLCDISLVLLGSGCDEVSDNIPCLVFYLNAVALFSVLKFLLIPKFAKPFVMTKYPRLALALTF